MTKVEKVIDDDKVITLFYDIQNDVDLIFTYARIECRENSEGYSNICLAKWRINDVIEKIRKEVGCEI